MLNKPQYTGCTISLDTCRCLGALTADERKELMDNSVVIHYDKGEIICKRGTFASHVMFMEDGLAKVYIEDGVNTLVLKVVPEGSLFGLSSINEENSTFQYSVKTYIPSQVRLFDIEVFRQLLVRNPVFSRKVIETLTNNNAQIYGRFFCMTHKQSYGRLADILICLSDMIFKKKTFELPLSRKDLAELSGMSPETVIRMLKKFTEDGLIDLQGKAVTINDYQRLKRISETG